MMSNNCGIAVALLITLLVGADPVQAAESDTSIDGLSNRILQKELELLTLNTRFRLETTEKSRFKPWRVFAYNLGASGVSNAGITTIAAERWRTWQRPATADRNTLKAGPILLLIGHSISLGGTVIEASLDAYNDRKTRKRGFDARTTKLRAIELQVAIDDLLMKRKQAELQRGQSDVAGGVASVEGQILQDLRDIAVTDYAHAYVRARKRIAARNFSYLNGAAAAATGGYIGSLCGLLAVVERDPRLAGPAGIGFILSGVHIAAGPIATKVVATIAGKRAQKQLEPELRAANKQAVLNFDRHRSELTSALGSQSLPADFAKRISMYETLNALTDEQVAMNLKEKQKADADFKERLVVNAIVGGTKIGWGVQLANAGFGFEPRLPTPTVRVPVRVGGTTVRVALPKPRGANELFAHRVAQGATTYIPGTGVWILDTLQSRVRGERQLYTMGSQEALPHQKLNRRLTKLDELRDQVPSADGV